jgi:uncharacterized membrane protein (DUF106 family)
VTTAREKLLQRIQEELDENQVELAEARREQDVEKHRRLRVQRRDWEWFRGLVQNTYDD